MGVHQRKTMFARLAGCGAGSCQRLRGLHQVRCNSTSSTNVFAATLIERRPVILPDPHPIETRFWDLQQQVREIRAVKLPDAVFAASTREQARAAEEGATKFEPAPRRTKADEQNDMRSLDRALDRTLYLLVQDGDSWNFPQCAVGQEDALHTAAAKVAEDVACHVSIIARTPVCHTEGADGSKVFYHLAELLPTVGSAYDNTLLENKLGEGFAWLTKEEVLQKLTDMQQRNVMSVILADGR